VCFLSGEARKALSCLPCTHILRRAVPVLGDHAQGPAAGHPCKHIWTSRPCQEGHFCHRHSFGCGDARAERKALGSLCIKLQRCREQARISSRFLSNAPRDSCCYPAYAEVVLLERSPKWFCVPDHLFPCTSRALFPLWPSPLISFLKVRAPLSAFLLVLLVICCRPSMPPVNCFILLVVLRPVLDSPVQER